jgi:hypothetical protein
MRMCHAMIMMMMILVVMVTTLQCCIPGVSAVRNLQIVVPLQSLTIWDPETQTSSSSAQSDTADATATATDDSTTDSYFRSKFLSKFRMGLQAEMQARKLLQQQLPNSNSIDNSNNKSNNNNNDSKSNSGKRNRNKRTNGDTNNNNSKNNSKDWAIQAARRDQQQHLVQEKIVEQAYDDATRHQRDNASIPEQHQQQGLSTTTTITTKNRNPYQFVGVITTHTNRVEQQPPIVWYTRKKPPQAKWTVRLIHPNRDAIIKDLYDRRKIDIFAKYTNLGIPSTTTTKASSQPVATTNTNTASYQPLIQSQYIVRERSWKNLWNMSWKHIWTDSSGMYWRERRLSSTATTWTTTTTPQLYTDGQTVYEATYRYRDGRNGMHKVSSMTEFLNSRSIDTKMKQRILRRLAKDVPDVVIEE